MIKEIQKNLIAIKDLAGNTFLTLLIFISITTAIVSIKVMQINIDSTWENDNWHTTNINLINTRKDTSLPSSLFNLLEKYSRGYDQSTTRIESIFPNNKQDSLSQNEKIVALFTPNNHQQNPTITKKVLSIIEDLSEIKSITSASKRNKIVQHNIDLLLSIQKEIELSGDHTLFNDVTSAINEIKSYALYYNLFHTNKKKQLSLQKIKEGIVLFRTISEKHDSEMRQTEKNILLKISTILIISFSFLSLILFYTNKSPKLSIKGESKKKPKRAKNKIPNQDQANTESKSNHPLIETNLSKLIMEILQDISFFIKQSQTEIIFKDTTNCLAKIRKIETTNNLKKLINGIIRLTKNKEQRNIKINLSNSESPRIQFLMEHLELTEELLWENWITDTHSFLCLDEILDQIEKSSVKVHLKNHYEEHGKFLHSTIEFEFITVDELTEVSPD